MFELSTNDLIGFDPSEKICLIFQSWCACHLCARQLHQFQVHAGRTIWDAATNFVQPVCCWEDNLLKTYFGLSLILPYLIILVSQVCRKGHLFRRLRTAAYDFVRWLRKEFTPVLFCKKIQNTKYLIQLLDVFVLNVGFANLTILRYVDRGIPLKGPSIFFYLQKPRIWKNGNTSHPPPHAACSALVDESDTAAGFSLHGT